MKFNLFFKDFFQWIDKQKYKIVGIENCELKLLNDDYTIVEHHLKFQIKLYQNGFNQRKAIISWSNYSKECPCFTPKEKNHPFWKEYVEPWLKGINVQAMPPKVVI